MSSSSDSERGLPAEEPEVVGPEGYRRMLRSVITSRAASPRAPFSWGDLERVRSAVDSADPSIVEEAWEFLAPYVREALANPDGDTPLDVSDAAGFVSVFARSPGSSGKVLAGVWEAIDADARPWVDKDRIRLVVLENVKCPPAVLLDILERFPDSPLAGGAVEHPNLPASAADRILEAGEEWLLTAWVLTEKPSAADVAAAYERGVAASVAARAPNASADLLERVAVDVISGRFRYDPVIGREVEARQAMNSVVRHPNASLRAALLALSYPASTAAAVDSLLGRWSEEQARLAEDLVRSGWSGSFDELCAAVEA